MEVYECVKERVTVRRFRPDPVPDATVARLLRAARWAPSSRNQQPWRLVVVRDRDTIESLARIATHGQFLDNAPVVIAVAMEDADRPELDAGRVLQQMELVAWEQGMGTCFVTLLGYEERAKEMLGIPAHMDLVTLLPFGYRADDPGGRGKLGKRRRPMSSMVYGERFGQAYTGL